MNIQQNDLQELCSRKLLDIFLTSDKSALKIEAKKLLDERKHFISQVNNTKH